MILSCCDLSRPRMMRIECVLLTALNTRLTQGLTPKTKSRVNLRDYSVGGLHGDLERQNKSHTFQPTGAGRFLFFFENQEKFDQIPVSITV